MFDREEVAAFLAARKRKEVSAQNITFHNGRARGLLHDALSPYEKGRLKALKRKQS